MHLLHGQDDPFIAFELSDILSAAGAAIVDPGCGASSVHTIIDRQVANVAALDWQLVRETASSIAARSMGLAGPFRCQTSSRGDPEAAHPGVTIADMPTRPEQLVLAATALTRKA